MHNTNINLHKKTALIFSIENSEQLIRHVMAYVCKHNFSPLKGREIESPPPRLWDGVKNPVF